MLKTVVFNGWIERIGGRFRRAWLAFFDIGAAMGVGLLVFVVYSFINNAIGLFRHSSSAGPTLLIIPLPGLTIGWDIFPYILLAIAVLLIPHEVAHGIASVLDKVPLKSSGVFMAVFLPGGFVEIDEENLAKRKARTKLRVFDAGSFTNVATWALVLVLLVALFQPSPTGVLVTGFTNVSAAQTAGLPQWSIITQVNNYSTSDVQHLGSYLGSLSPGTNVTVHLTNPSQTLKITTGRSDTNSSKAIIGVQTANYDTLRYQILPYISSNLYFNEFSLL